jgi:hypothetical protein
VTKKLKRLFRDKHAITPVLSNVLLMVVAVAAMAIATTATYVITTNLKETMSERIIAEDIWFSNSTLDIKVYLSNVGKVAVQVSAVYVNHTKQSFEPTPFSLEIGAHDWLSILSSWSSGNLYYVDIVTTRGTHVAEYYKAT